MANETIKRDANYKAAGVVGGLTNDASLDIVQLRVDPTTKRLLVDASASETIVDIEDGDGDSIMDTTNDAMQVSIVNDSVGIGGGTQYVEDTAHATGDTGTMALAVENEDQADLSTGDRDYTPIAVTKEGNIIVKQEGAVSVTESSPLTGFATSANQVTDNAVLDNVALYTAGSETALEKIDGAIVGPGEPTIDSYTHLAINLGVVTDSVLVASAANKQIWVYGISFVCSVAGTVSFQDEDNTAITGIMPFATNSGLSHPPSGNFAMPIWKLATNKDLEVDTVTCSIDGWLDYAIVSV